MNTILLLILLVQTLALIILVGLAIALAYQIIVLARSLKTSLRDSLDELREIASQIKDVHVGEKLRKILANLEEATGDFRDIASSTKNVIETPKAIGSAAKEFFEKTAKTTREKAVSVKSILEAVVYGLAQGWKELTKDGHKKE